MGGLVARVDLLVGEMTGDAEEIKQLSGDSGSTGARGDGKKVAGGGKLI